jgi:hypothetical protein
MFRSRSKVHMPKGPLLYASDFDRMVTHHFLVHELIGLFF